MTDKYEKELRQILKEYEFKMIRISKNGHEIWRLPDGHHFNCNGPNSSLGRRSWRNNIGNLRNLIKKHSIRKPILPLTNKRNEKQMNTTKTIMSIALTKVQIDLKAKDLEKKRKRIQNAIDVDGEGSTAQIHEIENIDKELIILAQQLTKFTGKTVPAPSLVFPPTPTHLPKEELPMAKAKRKTYVRRMWSRSEDEILLDLVLKDWNRTKIAKKMGRTRSSIHGRINVLDLLNSKKKIEDKKLNILEKTKQPIKEKYLLIIRFPGGKEASIPISKSKAEEYALKILADEL